MPTTTIRRLGPGDAPVLADLAAQEHHFEVDGPDGDDGHAEADAPAHGPSEGFLTDPDVCFWVAEADDGRLLGFLWCQRLRRRAAPPELLLYEIGVHREHRRRGVGRALVGTMYAWMAEHAVEEVWVLADNDGAVAFYRACGLEVSPGQATYMVRAGGA